MDWKVLLAIAALWWTQIVSANVEKAIFLGPGDLQIPLPHPTIENFQLQALSPLNATLRTKLFASFPTDTKPKGETTWFVLDGLTPGQRYELRICWAAIQPTSFDITTYELPEVFRTSQLITSLAEYTERRQDAEASGVFKSPSSLDKQGVSQHFKLSEQGSEGVRSVLFLRIDAAADYYTMNRTLMENVPPVLVDIILDPYILNIFPQSLIPTAFYLIAIATGGWYLTNIISGWLQRVSGETEHEKHD